MNLAFDSLDILGLEIEDLVLRRSVLVLRTSRYFPDRWYTEHYELQFNRILNSTIKISSLPFLQEISERRALKESAFLTESLKSAKQPHIIERENLLHFIVNFDRGGINVIAEDFTFSAVQRVTDR